MRNLISMFMTCTLLIISCMPSVSLAAMCAMPLPASASIEKLAAEYADKHQNHTMAMTLQHDDMMHGDWQTSRIECGCGCHQHLDSLPHLLSPHIMSQAVEIPKNKAVQGIEFYAYSRIFYIPSVQLPPPNLI